MNSLSEDSYYIIEVEEIYDYVIIKSMISNYINVLNSIDEYIIND